MKRHEFRTMVVALKQTEGTPTFSHLIDCYSVRIGIPRERVINAYFDAILERIPPFNLLDYATPSECFIHSGKLATVICGRTTAIFHY